MTSVIVSSSLRSNNITETLKVFLNTLQEAATNSSISMKFADVWKINKTQDLGIELVGHIGEASGK